LHGIVSGSGANLIYTPVAGYSGSDSFTFKANDGTTDSNLATVSIIVTPVNDAPMTSNQMLITPEDIAKDIVLMATDVDGDILSYLILTQPTHGTLTGTGASLTYTPSLNYFGSDSFTFSANDGSTDSNIATISLDVTPVNDPPIITPLPDLLVREDSLLQVCLNVVDPEGDEVVFNLPSNTSGGGTMVHDVAPFDFCFIFTPSPNFNGTSIWVMKVSDIFGLTGTTPLNIIVTPVNDAPILSDIVTSTKKNTPLTGSVFSLSDIDPDGTILNVNTVPQSGPSNGVILINADGSYTYTPALNFFGKDKVNIQICDSGIPLPSACATKVLTVDVTTINTLPPASLTVTTAEDTPTSFCFNYVDPQGDKITLGPIVNISGGGTLKATNSASLCFDFSPALNFNGASVWEIEICDDGLPSLCTKLNVTIDVTPVNDPPVALRDSIVVLRRVLQDGNVLSNDYDIEGDGLYVNTTPVINVLHGELTLNSDGRFTYISDRTFRGIDSLVYEVCDNGSPSKCSKATLVINVEDLPLRVYEGITPNGDGVNDYLRIDGIDFYPNCLVRIFDRYNNLVFEMSGYNNEEKIWRGVANKGIGNDILQEGTYFYTVNLGDGSASVSGFVVLKRN
jgi:gliding motility-associated-like protein